MPVCLPLVPSSPSVGQLDLVSSSASVGLVTLATGKSVKLLTLVGLTMVDALLILQPACTCHLMW